jgi:hypothetical protein
MRLGACAKHRHGDKDSRSGTRERKKWPGSARGTFRFIFPGKLFGANIWCAVLAEFPGEVAVSSVSSPKFRGGRAGGAAVALAVENRIIPCCLFFGRFSSCFFGAKSSCQYLQALPQDGVFQGFRTPISQFLQLPFPFNFHELVQNSPDFIPVALNAFRNFRYLNNGMAFRRVSTQSLA